MTPHEANDAITEAEKLLPEMPIPPPGADPWPWAIAHFTIAARLLVSIGMTRDDITKVAIIAFEEAIENRDAHRRT